MARTNRSVTVSTVSKRRAPSATSKVQSVSASVQKMAKVVALPGRGTPPEPFTLDVARVVTVKNGAVTVTVPRLGSDSRTARSLVAPDDLVPDDQVIVAPLGGSGSDGDLVILGRLHDPLAAPRDVRVNGRKVSIEADSELILKCAAATIRIGSNGLVAVRGDQVVTQARGVNRIRGGSVEIN